MLSLPSAEIPDFLSLGAAGSAGKVFRMHFSESNARWCSSKYGRISLEINLKSKTVRSPTGYIGTDSSARAYFRFT